MNTLTDLRRNLEQRKGKCQQVEKNIKDVKKTLLTVRRNLKLNEKAREVIKIVGLKTQQQLQFRISNLTTLALMGVFDDPYDLVVEFIERRNKTECDLYFERNGCRVSPLSAAGGGAVDVAAFALRTASWSMKRPRTRPVLFLDEPFRFLSINHLPKAGEMIKQISEKLNLQIIMVTHLDDLVENADRVFRVTMKNGKSIVEVETTERVSDENEP